MIDREYLIIFIRVLIVIFGFLLSWKALSISRKSEVNHLAYGLLSFGFFVFTISQVLEGFLFEFTNFNINLIHIIEGILSSIGFALIIISITKFKVQIK